MDTFVVGQEPPGREEKTKVPTILVMVGSRHQRGLVDMASFCSLIMWELLEIPLDTSWNKVPNCCTVAFRSKKVSEQPVFVERGRDVIGIPCHRGNVSSF